MLLCDLKATYPLKTAWKTMEKKSQKNCVPRKYECGGGVK